MALGANGGVGSTLVQLARHAGMTVIGTASARHHPAVEKLGAIPVDHRDPGMYRRIHALAPNGRSARFYNFWAGERRAATFRGRLRADLTAVFALLADGALTPQIAATFPLVRAPRRWRSPSRAPWQARPSWLRRRPQLLADRRSCVADEIRK